MIKNYLITGDTHGRVMERLTEIFGRYEASETALIILGDAGFNFYLNNTDRNLKKKVNNTGYTIYCVRGNHEERPENIHGMESWYDVDIEGLVYREEAYPNIRYLMDGHAYLFNNHPTLIIGGAYSVDKWYRLSKKQSNGWTGWFEEEQLSPEEMEDISKRHSGKHYDFIWSHTCPISWEPRDLFLSAIDQSTVDKSMEKWLDDFKNHINWNVWLFGHYHDDRLVRPGAEMFYGDIENLEDVYQRWTSGNEPEWYLKKDPNYYMEEGNGLNG